MASVATVVTMGFGSFGSVNLLPTIGFGIGEETETVISIPVSGTVTRRGPNQGAATRLGPNASAFTRLGPNQSTPTRP